MRYLLFIVAMSIALVRLMSGGLAMRVPDEPTLTVRHEAKRVVMHVSGKVKEPMRQRFADAFRDLGEQPQRVLVTLDSPGGYLHEGMPIIDVIRRASQLHLIETVVENGKVCASMCVPIYLAGSERSAGSTARFMFHEVGAEALKSQERARVRNAGQATDVPLETLSRWVEVATDELFEKAFVGRADSDWLARLRERIRGREVWLTARQLVDEKSAIVKNLLR